MSKIPQELLEEMTPAVRAFVEALLEGTPYSPDLEEGLTTFALMEAVRRSAETGKAVPLRPILDEIGL